MFANSGKHRRYILGPIVPSRSLRITFTAPAYTPKMA